MCPWAPSNAASKELHSLFLSGFVEGCVIFTVLMTVVIMVFCSSRPPLKKKITKKNKKMEVALRRGKGNTARETSQDVKISSSEKLVVRMSYAEVYKATKGFSQDNIIGMGETGTTYKAALPDGLLLAVKRFHVSNYDQDRFESELMTLGRLSHCNVVPLLGFCIETERVLAYKFMANGNLFDLLHCTQVKGKVLEWPLRVKIAVGLARGLAWLHYNSKIQLCHHNISSKCILLDHNFDPKISNFGGARVMNINQKTSAGSSSLNSEAPEHKDVYSFGIVLLELVTGEEPSKVTSDLASGSFGFCDIIDKSLMGHGYDSEIFHFLRVAGSCIHPFQDDGKPTMLDVYETLQSVGKRYSHLTDKSEFDSDRSIQTVIASTNASHRNELMGAELTEEIE